MGTVARPALLRTVTRLPPPSHQVSQNIHCLAQVQVFVGCGQRQQPPLFASEYAWVPIKTKVSALCDQNGSQPSKHATLMLLGTQRNEIQYA
jgi:hypothetical protein